VQHKFDVIDIKVRRPRNRWIGAVLILNNLIRQPPQRKVKFNWTAMHADRETDKKSQQFHNLPEVDM
jgi:hypothetical protein